MHILKEWLEILSDMLFFAVSICVHIKTKEIQCVN